MNEERDLGTPEGLAMGAGAGELYSYPSSVRDERYDLILSVHKFLILLPPFSDSYLAPACIYI